MKEHKFGVFLEFDFSTRRKFRVRFSNIEGEYTSSFDKEIDEMLQIGDIVAQHKGARPTESLLAEIKAEIESRLKKQAETYWDGDVENFLTVLYISKKHREFGLRDPIIYEGDLSF